MNKTKKKPGISFFLVIALCIAAAVLIAAIVTLVKPGRAVFKSIKVEGSTIYYTKSAGIKKAQQAGEAMKKYGIIKSDHEIDMRVDKKDGSYVIYFISTKARKYSAMLKALFAEVLKMMQADEFAGERVTIMLCGDNFTGCESVK
jgi:hypothetical protein